MGASAAALLVSGKSMKGGAQFKQLSRAAAVAAASHKVEASAVGSSVLLTSKQVDE